MSCREGLWADGVLKVEDTAHQLLWLCAPPPLAPASCLLTLAAGCSAGLSAGQVTWATNPAVPWGQRLGLLLRW